MKKIILGLLVTFGLCSMVSAEIGIKVGVSTQIGEMEASGKETSSAGTSESGKEKHLFATGGFFIEKDLAFLPGPFGRLSIGYDNIVHDLDLGTQNNLRSSTLGAAGAVTTNTNHSLNAKLTGFETIYATLNITDWLYIKGGSVTVDLDTEFKGTATSKYAKSHSLDGTVMGFGIHKEADSGWFARLEYNDYDIDGKTVSNTGADTKFSATLNDVSGTTTRVSFGKAF